MLFRSFLGVNMQITPSGGSAYTPVGSTFSFDAGTSFETVENFNSATGIEAIIHIDRNPSMTVSIAQDNYASAALTYANIFANIFAQTTHNVTFTLGSTNGNIATFTAPTAQLVDAQPRLNGGHRNIDLMYKVQGGSSAESEYSIVTT